MNKLPKLSADIVDTAIRPLNAKNEEISRKLKAHINGPLAAMLLDGTKIDDTDDSDGILDQTLFDQLIESWREEGNRDAPFFVAYFMYLVGKPKNAYTYCQVSMEMCRDIRAKYLYAQLCAEYNCLDYEKFTHSIGDKLLRQIADEDIGSFPVLFRGVIQEAAYQAGILSYFGIRCTRNESIAEKLWCKAADETIGPGCVQAQTLLAQFYSDPDRLCLPKVLAYHELAAENGNIDAVGVLGVMYANGLGVERDLCHGLDMLCAADDAGSLYARGHLIELFFERKMFTKACHKAANIHFENTSDLGANDKRAMSIAAFIYAMCLTLGRGVLKDNEMAQQLFSLSAALDLDICSSYSCKYLRQYDI